ncbi:glycosyltransferase family 2 protein [Patescibacteria group bacterium]|nr:glycosyltransferase family 2 protein [Patescibacteria group bacterium]
MPNNFENLSVVIPVFNEDHSIIEKTVKELEALGIEVIVVDDGSDNPYPTSIKHGFNAGYGGAILTGIKNATRPIIMTLDGDGQHRVKDVENLWTVWNILDVDMIVGVRRLQGEKWYRYLGRKFLNTCASILALYWLPDLNSGMRVMKAQVVKGYTSILCKQFSFTTSLTLSMILDGLKIEWFPIKVEKRAVGNSRVKIFKHGIITLYYIVRIGFALRTRRIRGWMRQFLRFT